MIARARLQPPARSAPAHPVVPRRVPSTARGADAGSTDAAWTDAAGHAFARISTLPPEGAPPLPPALGPLPVHWRSARAERAGVAGLAAGGVVHLASEAERLPAAGFAHLVAHEAAHLAQAGAGRAPGARADVELEAHQAADALLAGRAFRPRFHPLPGQPLHDTPHEEMVVERARARLALLERFQAECTVRDARRTQTGAERSQGLEARRQLDETMTDPATEKGRQDVEDATILRLNRRPLEVSVSEAEVRFRVRFHARFEDPAQAGRFGELVRNLQAGIDLVWNQPLPADVLGGRRLVVEPVVTPVSATDARDRSAWLITVRPRDDSPVTHPGCDLPQPDEGDPTSVTDPLCDGGVMSIPPRHVALPHVLGHELMHLFGLVDRYRLVTLVAPDGTELHGPDPLRDTGGRPDPLATQKASMLSEDLSYILDRLGVYEMEEERGLDTLRMLEARGMSCTAVAVEISRQEEIVRLGRDPRSMIRPRTDFDDRMIQDAERL